MDAAPRDPINLALLQDFTLGTIEVSPSTRNIRGPAGKKAVEPRMMQVLVALAREAGGLVTRTSLLDRCWGGVPVGDDSLNRVVVGLRRAFRESGSDAVRIETIPGAGYMLTLAAGEDDLSDPDRDIVAASLQAGWQSWKLGMPEVDHDVLGQLRRAAAARPRRADVHGMLALVLRNAAEYADLAVCPSLVHECQTAAAHALTLDPHQIHARSALIGLPPLYGDWLVRRAKLLDTLDDVPDNPIAAHDLCMLEMATGRPYAAVALSGRLLEREPLAATLHYKHTYQLWTTGRLTEMDRVADRGMQLWPRHPAIWYARLWSFAFTQRPLQAAQQLGEESSRPGFPAPALATLEKTLAALIDPGDRRVHQAAVDDNMAAAERGPVQSIAAIIHLAGLGEVDAAFQVAEGYLLRRGPVRVGVHKTAADPSITDQNRRVTQMLFLPVTAQMRDDPRFLRLCDDMGLTAYWQAANLVPDFLAAASL